MGSVRMVVPNRAETIARSPEKRESDVPLGSLVRCLLAPRLGISTREAMDMGSATQPSVCADVV